MGNLVTPLQFATVASALIWPLVAGVGVVMWSRARAANHARRVAAMETQLQDFYGAIESKPIPQRLAMVVEALEEGQELAPTHTAAKAKRVTSAKS